jgi:hypothetical protein
VSSGRDSDAGTKGLNAGLSGADVAMVRDLQRKCLINGLDGSVPAAVPFGV